jgi:hypothetical protein
MIITEHPKELINILKSEQDKLGYLSDETIIRIAADFGIPVNEVYAVASFYSFMCVKPTGRNVIRVCKSLPCYLKLSETVVKWLEQELGIRPGETTLKIGRRRLEPALSGANVMRVILLQSPHLNPLPQGARKLKLKVILYCWGNSNAGTENCISQLWSH